MRKRLLIVSLFTLTFTFTRAQVYYPFPDSGAVWNVVFEYQSTATNYYGGAGNFSLGGDTIIGSHTYSILYSNNSPIGGIRNDTANQRVYFAGNFQSNNFSDTLLYDFSLNAGDTAYYSPMTGQYAVVSSVDSVFCYNAYRKRLMLNFNYGDEWVEGIGSLNYILEPFDYEFEWNNTVICMQDSGVTYYITGAFPTYCNTWHYYPPYCGLMSVPENIPQAMNVGVSSGYGITTINISGAKGDCSVNVYDVSGKRIFSKEQVQHSVELQTASLPGGMYLLQIEDESGNLVTRKIVL